METRHLRHPAQQVSPPVPFPTPFRRSTSVDDTTLVVKSRETGATPRTRSTTRHSQRHEKSNVTNSVGELHIRGMEWWNCRSILSIRLRDIYTINYCYSVRNNKNISNRIFRFRYNFDTLTRWNIVCRNNTLKLNLLLCSAILLWNSRHFSWQLLQKKNCKTLEAELSIVTESSNIECIRE